jgi:membrane protease YdiL (CAAX protease family)
MLVVTGYTISLALAMLEGYPLRPCGILGELVDTTGPWLVPVLILAGLLAGVTLNAVIALGEEVAWRGYLLDRIAGRIGLIPASLVIGVIWGLWHAPLILRGYNYSLGFLGECGSPAAGPEALLAFIVFTTSLGALLAMLRSATGSTIVAAMGHGTVNGVASVYALIIEGPRLYVAPAGLLVSAGFIPVTLLAAMKANVLEGKRR